MRHFKFSCAIALLLQTPSAAAEIMAVPWFDNKPVSEKYERVTTEQHAELEAAFLALFRDQHEQPVSAFYELYQHQWQRGEQQRQALLAASKPDLGWGLWGYQPAQAPKVFLQAPHRFYDRGTAHIAEIGWRANLAELMMMSSVHRNTGAMQEPAVNSDISNARRSALLAASEAWLAVNPEGVIVQLHGFAKEKRKTMPGKRADIILSHGTNARFLPDSRLQAIQSCLISLLNVQVLRYPDQVGELGGTQNNVARALARWSKSEQLVHVELSREVRAMLVDDPDTTEKALRCIAGAVAE
ncbi:hypothetical protein [Pseudidiomarina sp.]|uniref:hypothetical protein n=1 Tax=Pseudidiomarina sp. TaxID=2081707 RepID=UPI00299CF0E9|nr:hypothetical protein [Pseudidiomarina sp.]MDX1706866.1 hypothetical protein [Pseudidiomarina sp.]